jgi:hypothetical protein
MNLTFFQSLTDRKVADATLDGQMNGRRQVNTTALSFQL